VSLILILGVSGVGKTTLCKSLVARRSDLVHVSASALIALETGASVDQLRRSAPDQVQKNQIVLQRALNRQREARTVLLDGQCAIDTGQKLVILTAEHVAAMHPNGILLLETSAGALFEQRQKDSKYRPKRTVEELQEQLSLNRSLVIEYAAELALPYRIVEAHDASGFERAIDEIRHF
jgi:adenylate kinase